MDPGVMYRYHSGDYYHSSALGFRGFLIDCPQLHSSWVPGQNVCNVVNSDSSIMACIATLVSDVVLLLTMLVGLIRLRRHDLMTGFGRLLWKQVGNMAPGPFWSLN